VITILQIAIDVKRKNERVFGGNFGASPAEALAANLPFLSYPMTTKNGLQKQRDRPMKIMPTAQPQTDVSNLGVSDNLAPGAVNNGTVPATHSATARAVSTAPICYD